MRIINVLEVINGIPSQIQSFPIYKEQLSQDVVDRAEKLFLELIEKNKEPLRMRGLSEEDIEDVTEFYLDEGVYDDKNGYEVYIIWSEVNE